MKEYIVRVEHGADGAVHYFRTGGEIVRCWDCIYWEPATLSSGNCGRAFEITAYKDDFCSYGERGNE